VETKSGIVHAIKFAMSGDLPGNKKDFVTWGQRTGGVELDFTCRDGNYTIIRSLHNSGVVLRNRANNESVIGHSDVNKRISALLGTRGRLVESLLFQSQGEVDAFFRMRPADRTKYFHNLFDTDRLSKINASLVAVVNGLSGHVVELPELMWSEAETSRLRYTEQLSVSNSALDALRLTGNTADVSKLQTELNNALVWRMQLASIEQQYPNWDFDSVIQSRKQQLTLAINQIENFNNLIATLQADLVTKNNQLEQFVQLQAAYRNQKLQWDRRTEAKANLDKAAAEPVVEVPAVLKEELASLTKKIEEWVADLAKNRATLNSLLQLNQTFSKADGCCPTCGTTKLVDKDGNVQDLNSLLARTAEFIKEANQLIATGEKSVAELRKQSVDTSLLIQGAQLAEDTRVRNLQHATYIFGALETVTPPGPEPVSSNSKSEVDAINAQLAAARQGLLVEQTTQNRLTQEITTLTAAAAQRKDLTEKLQTVDFVKLESQLKTLIVHKQQVEEQERSIAVFSKELQEVTERIKVLNATRAKTKRAKDRIELVETLRNIFHPTALPLEIVKRQTNALELIWNELLSILAVPFNVLITQGLDVNFEYMTPAGKVSTDAASASGGQLCCAGLAMNLAAHRLFCPEAGFVVLDEPTYGLDANHVELVGDLFDKLESYAESNRLQILLVSHEATLKDKFKSVISL